MALALPKEKLTATSCIKQKDLDYLNMSGI
jgi:hypothetical protein